MFFQKKIFFLILPLFLSSCQSDRLGMGYRFYMQGKYKEANHSLLVHLSGEPERLEKAFTYFYLGLVNADWGNRDKAIEYYTKAIDLEPTYFYAYFNRGLEYMLNRDFSKALLDIQQADKIINNLPEDNASKKLYNPKKLAFDKKIIMIYQAMLNIQMKNYSQTEILLNGLIKQEVKDKNIYFFIADIYLANSPMMDPVKALLLCETALKNSSDHRMSLNDLLIYSRALAANDKFSNALNVLEKITQENVEKGILKKEYQQQKKYPQISLEYFFDRWLKQQGKRSYPETHQHK